MSQDRQELMRKCLKCDQTVLDGAVKFIVGPEKKVFSIERSKLEKYLYSLEQYNGEECPVNVSVELFQVFVDLVDDKDIVITSILGAFELMKFAKSISCPKLHETCDQYLMTHCKGEHILSIYEYAKTNGLCHLADNCFDYIISDYAKLKVADEECTCRKLTESGKKDIKSSNNVVKFLVGPEKAEYTIEKEKMAKFLHSMDPFNGGECILDIPVDSFQVFLNMVNEEHFVISSATMAFELLWLAEKLIWFRLHDISVEHLRTNYECDRALAIYIYAEKNNLIELADNCLEYIEDNFVTLIETEDFLQLDVETIAELYSSKNLNATELDLVKALISYVKRQGNVDMKVAVDKIVFEDITIKQLVNLEGIDHLLTDKQLLQMMAENCGCEKPKKTRAECKILIDYNNLKSYVMTNITKFKCSLTFSQNIYLENVQIKMRFKNITRRISLAINNTEKNTDMNDLLVDIKQTIKKDDEICMILHLDKKYSIKSFKGTISTEERKVIIKPEEDGLENFVIIDSINIKGIDRTKTLEITLKTEELTE